MKTNKNAPATQSGFDDKSDADELETLRALLLAHDRKHIEALQKQLETLETRINDPHSRTADTSEILVQAMRTRLATDDKLSDALKPVVVEQFRQTSINEPEVMAEALFPILGPAIRKMIAAMLTPDKKSKKRTYRLEQLFLIEKETGLPICHAASDSAITQDADMVSGMLSAIQSFVHEAFSADDFDGLNTLQVGELAVWIEWGPSAILAAVIRGAAPEKLREAMQLQLEQIHHNYTDQLNKYDGDSKPFEPLKPELNVFLDSHDGTLKNKVKSLPALAKKWLFGTTIVVFSLACWMIFQSYDKYRWNQYVAIIDAQPGIIVTTNERHFRHYILRGLKDPLAQHPTRLLAKTNINTDYVMHIFEPYQALHAAFVLTRVQAVLHPPANVKLAVEGTTLQVTGGDRAFVAKALRLAPIVTGIDNVSVR